jgi:hypothetical protein
MAVILMILLRLDHKHGGQICNARHPKQHLLPLLQWQWEQQLLEAVH